MDDSIKLLTPEQAIAFDTEYIDEELFGFVTRTLSAYLDTPEEAHFLDVGGGNGIYADKLLKHYSGCHVTVVEPEACLLNKNVPHENKHLKHDLFQNVTVEQEFDLIQFNWVLHHFVSDTYEASCHLQENALIQAYKMLKPGGMVVIFENFYEGAASSDRPGQLLFNLTASKVLAPLTKKMGANTAGIGVCFHSELYWRKLCLMAGFKQMASSHCYDFGNLSPLKKRILQIENQRVGLLIAVKPNE
ncbi:class I SAM-dependent methyltransferase [Vibrio sinensis]|uniref:Class I SAM-dependent methyltransferase n=1 Tax=Vibrio sinensis TaxID=2302434 RepID=A0A3A6R2G9_9VIBR|nr:class I SAM-dependent methyltransferase [Vibrio sinensis]RJX75327.1 class I SAM-dependent methyltransferase [Vibrio sinensis]